MQKSSSEQRPFRLHHLLLLLEEWDRQNLPLDSFLRDYFRARKAIGSKDRKWIAERTYELVRWQLLVDALVVGPLTWEARIKALDRLKTADLSQLPPHIRVSCPEDLFELLLKAYGEEKASELCRVSNERAPLTIRVNLLKTIREELTQSWADEGILFSPCETTTTGLNIQSNVNFFAHPDFKAGKFELQDEGSQRLAELVAAGASDWVLDYCAGAGGKSLAIAAHMKNRGQLYLHDIRDHALVEAKKRLKRAGVQNAQILYANDPKKAKLKRMMDWVLVDAPCSGTGTLRRNPDLKWRFRKDSLLELCELQRRIFAEALTFAKPGAAIVYATCSILPEENEEQTAFFIERYGLKLTQSFKCLPEHGKMDGFYGAVFYLPA